MRTRVKAALLGVGGAMMVFSGTALAAPAADGVFFIHGTGDYAKPSTQVNPTDGAASSYWKQATINQYIADPAGGNWTYGVAGYQGASKNAMSAAYDVATQIEDFYDQNAAIYNIVLVTHSNGANVVRYMMAHPSSTDAYGTSYGTILSWVKRVVFLAGSNTGTPLCDKVTTAGSLANIASAMWTFFGGTNWNNPAVHQQVQANMATYNANGTFAVGSSPGGISTYFLYGTNVYAAIWSSDAWCGGYTTTVALRVGQLYGWGSTTAPYTSDGVVGWNTYYGDLAHYSPKYVGVNGMPGGSGDQRLNHHQISSACHGIASTLTSTIHGAMSGTFSVPSDYTISPSAQACVATVRGWQSDAPYSGESFYYGCTSGMQSDSVTDPDCQIAYGGDNGQNFTFNNGYSSTVTVTNPDGTTTTSSVPVTDAYSTSWYGNSSLVNCSDSWLGDGVCDLCLVAKYGFDAKPGTNGADDCVVHPSITNGCSTTGAGCAQNSDCGTGGTCDTWVHRCVTSGTTPCSNYGAFYGCVGGTCTALNSCADLAWYDPYASGTPSYTPSATNTTPFNGASGTPGVGYFSYVAVHN